MREFRAKVGFDDNPIIRNQTELPELVFSVQADGKTLWSSTPMRLGDAPQEAAVKLGDVKELVLHIRASRAGATATSVEYYAQANWVDPDVRLADGSLVELGQPLTAATATEAAKAGKGALGFSAADRDVVRRLAEQVAKIAALPEQKRRIGEWKRLNALRGGKPLVLIYTTESPLHELDQAGELTLRTKHPFCQRVEQELRMRLFQWKHVRCDMVMEEAYHVPYVWHDSGMGFTASEDIRITDPDSPIVGHHYHVQIRDEKDLERIKPPTVIPDREMTERNYHWGANCWTA